MPNNVKRKLSKIKGHNTAHPFSRKAVQVRRALIHTEHKADKVARRDAVKANRATKIFMLQEQVQNFYGVDYEKLDDKDANADIDFQPLTEEEIHGLVMNIIERNDEEIGKLIAQRRKGRPPPPKLQLLQDIKDNELKEYKSGSWEVPILSNKDNLKRYALWDGDLNSLPLIKMQSLKYFVKVNKDAMDTMDR